MSKIINLLKKTPLRELWWKVKKYPPIRKLRSLEGKIHRYYTLKIQLPKLYQACAAEPVDEKKVVFFEVRLPELTNSFSLLYKELKEDGRFDIHVHYLRNTFVRRSVYDKNCQELVKDIATAKYVFANEASNVLSCVPMRPETIVTQTWHGCGAFKKFGFSTAERIFGLDRKNMLKYPYYKNYTYVTLSSPEVAWAYEEAMNLSDQKEVLKPVGSSRTDVFFDPDFIDSAYEHLREVMPESRGKKVILYAPTFRGRVANGKAPDKMDIPMFMEKLGEEYVLVIKQHPLVRKRPEIPEECSHFAKDVTEEMTIDDLLCVSDICISDYSSLVFEYSLFERPMIFFAYDKAEYDDWRGFYYDYEEMTPGPICTENEEIIDYIQNLDTRFDKQRVVDFKYKFMRSCDGHATERILSMVTGEPWIKKQRLPEEIKVSVVMPVYNAGQYLKDAIRSIRNQTLKEIELICVDDGSTDDSVSVIQEQMERDGRISLIRQKNSYAGVARNNGFAHAKGEYVIFLDADDLFAPEMLEKMYEKAKATEADICVCAGQKLKMDTYQIVKTDVYLDKKHLPTEEVFSKETLPNNIFSFASNVPWNKLFRKAFIEEHELRFQPLKQANDTYFVLCAMFLAQRITALKDRFVTYRTENQASLTGKASDTMLCAYESYAETWRELQKYSGFSGAVKKDFQQRFLRGMIHSLHIQSDFDAFQTIYRKVQEEGIRYFELDDLEEADFQIKWHYTACQNIQTMSPEDYLVWDAIRLDATIEQRNSSIIILKEKNDKIKKKNRILKEEIKKEQSRIRL